MLSGLMMQIAMQLGLHRPVQAEEFTTFQMGAQGEALKDRLHTWIICNMVAQKYVFPAILAQGKAFSFFSFFFFLWLIVRKRCDWLRTTPKHNVRLGS
jgi:hypothetical protein